LTPADVVRDEPIILCKKIEDVPEAGAILVGAAAFIGSHEVIGDTLFWVMNL
jgi:hypothetical protein